MRANNIAIYQGMGSIPQPETGKSADNRSVTSFADVFTSLKLNDTANYAQNKSELSQSTQNQYNEEPLNASENINKDNISQNEVISNEKEIVRDEPSKVKDNGALTSGNEKTDYVDIASEKNEEKNSVVQDISGLLSQLTSKISDSNLKQMESMGKNKPVKQLSEKIDVLLSKMQKEFDSSDLKNQAAALAEKVKNALSAAKQADFTGKAADPNSARLMQEIKGLLLKLDADSKDISMSKGKMSAQTSSKSETLNLDTAVSMFFKGGISKDVTKLDTKSEKNLLAGDVTDKQIKAKDALKDFIKGTEVSKEVSKGQSEKSDMSKEKLTTAKSEVSENTPRADFFSRNVNVTSRSEIQPKEGNITKATNQESVIKNINEIKAMLDKQIFETKEAKTTTMTIKLNPEELGKIKIQLDLLENGKMQGKVFVENEMTRNALQQQADILRASIKAQGVSLENFEVYLGGEGLQESFYEFDRQSERQKNELSHSKSTAYQTEKYDEELSELLEATHMQGDYSKLNILV